MINKSNEYPRRILSFPAIRPSETVSFPSLIASLIHLGHVIIRDFKSQTFFTNRKKAKFMIRLVDDLLIFLQEIQNGDSRFEGSMILSLSELHFLFQKVVFLLEDCSREEARLWMVAKSEHVSVQFRVVARAIAVALDVLPFDGIGGSNNNEVKEVVEFVRKQAMKFKFEVEVEDRRILDGVMRILEQFKCGVVPESSDLKWVLESLGIRSWSECQNGVRFLESEICLEGQSEEIRDSSLVSDLIGFLIFCRCTVFEFGDFSTTRRCSCSKRRIPHPEGPHIPDRQGVKHASRVGGHVHDTRRCSNCGGGGRNDDVIRCLNLDDFRCPIALELMTDPVTLATGHTYDRTSILKWFRAGNHTCPITGERLMSIDLVPNLALKQIIRQYCNENGITFPECLVRNRDVASSGVAMKLLARLLVGRLSEQQNKVCYEIRLLTKTSDFNRSCLSEAGVIPPLLLLLSSWDSSVQENSIAALLNLSKNSRTREIIAENGGLVLILDVLKEGLKMEARQHAAGALFYLASVEEYRAMIGENPEAIQSLVELIRAGSDHAKKNALVTIFSLLTCPENHWRVTSAGLVPLLVDLLTSLKHEDLITDCLAILSSLAENREGGATVVLYAGALPIVTEILNSCTSRAAKECCVSILLALCINGGSDAVRVLVKNPSLMPPLYLLLTQGSPRASKKASSLIRLLQEFNDKTPSGLITPGLPQERFVNVW